VIKQPLTIMICIDTIYHSRASTLQFSRKIKMSEKESQERIQKMTESLCEALEAWKKLDLKRTMGTGFLTKTHESSVRLKQDALAILAAAIYSKRT